MSPGRRRRFRSGALKTASGRPIRVLISEHEALIAMEMKRLIDDMGGDVVGTATTLDGACQLADRHAYDIAVIDVRLKNGESGVELARRLRAEHGVPTVFVTALGDAETSMAVEAFGPAAFVLKPTSAGMLRDAILKAHFGR